MALSALSRMLLSLLLFVSYTSPLSHARLHPEANLNVRPSSPRKAKPNSGRVAEQLIRGLNLLPKHAINLVNSSVRNAPEIVGKDLELAILGDPGTSVNDLAHHAGYYRLPNTTGARMFYFFFESRNSKDDPVVIWLTGGPGCSSELALFYENGPFQLSSNLSLVWNDYGWDKASNLIYVDQPTGTGFSYSTSENDIRTNEAGVSNDLYNFLQAFFEGHPQFSQNDFYITGESYAGHYIPAFAARIYQGNTNNEGMHINLKGFAIGNGLTNPAIQFKAYPEFALDNKLIQQSDYENIKGKIPACEEKITACDNKGDDSDCLDAFSTCIEIYEDILSVAGNINFYDIRKKCEGQLCYDFSRVENFLNEDTVKNALGVGNIDWVSCSMEVHSALQADWMKNYEVEIPPLLEAGIKVLIYAGEDDLICNWLENSWWVNAMEWSGQKQFAAAPMVPFVVGGTEAGQLKSHGPLSFLKVHNAGHLVPMDQPEAALQMLKSWLQVNISVTE